MIAFRFVPGALAALLAAASLAAQANARYEQALARYKECIQRLVFNYHTEGRDGLAKTRTPEALSILTKDYLETKSYPDYARYSLAAMFGRSFDGPDFAAPLALLRKSASKPVDTWLWVNTLRGGIKGGTSDDALAVVRDDKSLLHKAAAIVALGQAKSDLLAQAITQTCVALPAKEGDRALLVGAMSSAIWDSRSKVNDAEFRKGLRSYIELLAPPVKLSPGLQLQLGRHLQWVLNAPAPFVDVESWLAVLDRGDVKKPTSSGTASQPRFFGVETDGERICYVLDLSDSMCKPIPGEWKPKAAATGPRKKREKGDLPDESDIPWNKVVTRFDLLRENLRISLERLPKEKYFSVVWFGDGAETLDACKGMVKATKANVDRVMAELDAITCGKPNPPKSPDGELRGKTNLHAGLKHAFGLSSKGYVAENAYVDPAALTEGCDTIFVLSDGAPSWDDFNVKDKDYGEGNAVVDSEYGAAGQRTPEMIYWGPYHTEEWLLEDVARMNAFRRVRMHCIGIGEANSGLLRKLADACHGVSFDFGKDSGGRKSAGAK